MKKVLKAGTILIDIENKKIALVYRQDLDDYSFPKGHLEKNESLIECAIRETEEETKRSCVLLVSEPYLISYSTSIGEEAIVYYYLAKDVGKSDNDSEDTHPVVWVSSEEVYNMLSYDDLKEMWLIVKDRVDKYFK